MTLPFSRMMPACRVCLDAWSPTFSQDLFHTQREHLETQKLLLSLANHEEVKMILAASFVE